MGVVNGQWWHFVAEVSPGLTLAVAGLVAAFVPYALMRRSGRGRARSAIAYLAGLAAGLAATVTLAVAFDPLARSTPIVEAGLFAAFFGPFAGMLRAKWERPARSRRRLAARGPYRQAASRP